MGKCNGQIIKSVLDLQSFAEEARVCSFTLMCLCSDSLPPNVMDWSVF